MLHTRFLVRNVQGEVYIVLILVLESTIRAVMTGGKEIEQYHSFTILFAGFIPTTSFLELPGATSTGMLQSVHMLYTMHNACTDLHCTDVYSTGLNTTYAQILWDQINEN